MSLLAEMEQLAALRVKRGLTQAAVARAMWVTPACVSMLESGKRCPRLDMLQSYAAVVGARIAVIELVTL